MLVYHGTIADNLASIREHGLKACPDNRNWTVSRNEVYFWGNRYMECEFPDWEDEERDPRDCLIKQAADSAMCGAGKAKDCRLVVVVCDIPDDEIESDDSCEFMEHASCITRDIRPDEIVEILVSNDLSLIRGYFISLMMERELSAFYFDSMETKVGELFSKVCFVDSMDEILEWENANVTV